jgi:predicted short-subunit dehydrogenase-like oxidoreductase (DUF2520 family)
MSTPHPQPPFEIALVGAGRVGTAVAHLLAARRNRIGGIWSRSTASAERAAHVLGARVVGLDTAVERATLVLLGVTDAAIRPIAERISNHLSAGTVVCHFAGALGTGPLDAVERSGGIACALHPVQSCPDVDTAVRRLPGSAWGITCAPEVRRWAEALVAGELHGTPVPVAEQDRPVWHAAAVVTANGLAALLAIGESLLAAIGASGAEVLGPLSSGVLANARGAGAAQALTGPLVRQEPETLRRHLAALRATAPELVDAYVAASRVVLAGALLTGRIDVEARAAMESTLDA